MKSPSPALPTEHQCFPDSVAQHASGSLLLAPQSTLETKTHSQVNTLPSHNTIQLTYRFLCAVEAQRSRGCGQTDKVQYSTRLMSWNPSTASAHPQKILYYMQYYMRLSATTC